MRVCDRCGVEHPRTNSPICDRCRRSGTKKPCPIDGCETPINAYARTCLMHRHIKTPSPSECVECGMPISRGRVAVCKPCQDSVRVLCACGCGKPRKKYGSSGLPHEYISGHNDSWVDARPPERTCAICRKAFRPSTLRQRLCSIECRTMWLTINPSNDRKRVPIPCASCGTVVYRTPCQTRSIRLGVVCSHRCRAGMVGAALAERVTQGKKVARLRDGAACRICGFALLSEVHHIVPRREGGSDDPSNLITLCPTHHEMADRGMVDREVLFAALAMPSSAGPIRIHTPLMHLTKAETVHLARRLDGCWHALRYSLTCYNGKRPGCGTCPACALRAKGFDEAGERDPALAA